MSKDTRTYSIKERHCKYLNHIKSDNDLNKSDIVNRALKMYLEKVYDPSSTATDPWLESQTTKKERAKVVNKARK